MAGRLKYLKMQRTEYPIKWVSPLNRSSASQQRARRFWFPSKKYWAKVTLSLLGLATLTAGAGCQQIKEHFNRVRPNNPVVGPPPPRISLDDTAVATTDIDSVQLASNSQTGDIVPISRFEATAPEIDESTVVAVVNSNQILASDIWAPYARQLKKMKEQMPEEQYNQARVELLKRDLPDHIERTMLAHALKTTLKQEQVEKLDGVLDMAFEEHVRKLLQKTGTNSALELDEKLKSEGTSLEDLRKTFGKHQLAMQYLANESEIQVQLGRQELLDYYNAHLTDYSHPTKVKWEELRISFAKHGGRDEALGKLNEAVKQLQAGRTFPEVVREFSDGPTASNGGEWDWTTSGSLANEEVDKILFELPVNGISRIIESEKDFRVLRVTGREDAHITPFEELQGKIRGAIMVDLREEKTAGVVNRLKQTATIETIFDNDPQTAAAMREFGKKQ